MTENITKRVNIYILKFISCLEVKSKKIQISIALKILLKGFFSKFSPVEEQ